MHVIRPTWTDLEAIVTSAREELLIVSPYITSDGIDHLFDAINSPVRVALVTRLSPSDWAHGASDPDALHAFLDAVDNSRLFVQKRLHAKLFAADRQRALLGSANLTGGGFAGNVELAVRLDGPAVEEAIKALQRDRDSAIEVDAEALRAWVESSRDTIQGVQRDVQEAETLANVQRSLDEILRRARGRSTRARPPATASAAGSRTRRLTGSDLIAFTEWINRNLHLPGAEEVATRYENSRGDNLTGHVKQTYFAARLFFGDHAEFLSPVVSTLQAVEGSKIFAPKDVRGLVEAWCDHVEANELEVGDDWSFAVLKGILPENLGGTVVKGGGGSSTLKRVLPLVAAMLEGEDQED